MARAGISDDDIERVRTATDIVTLFSEIVPLQQKGQAYWCVCPFHSDKNPSLKIDPSRQSFHCFGCNASGDVFKFVQLTEDMGFLDAVRKLAERAHIELSGGGRSIPSGQLAKLKEICAATAAFYHKQLMRLRTPVADDARAYLSKRALGGGVPERWSLGFAPGGAALVRHLTSLGFSGEDMVAADVAVVGRDGRVRDRFFDRIMFPIFDIKGECIAFGGRVIGKGEPKYLNSKETPIFKKSKELFGLSRAKDAIVANGTALIMEGYTDVILAHEAGVQNAVATLGTALTINHIRQLSRFAKHRIVYLFDGDEAGQRAIERALQFIDSSMTPEAGRMQVELCAVTLPDNLDPADYIAAHGADAFRACVAQAVPLIEFGTERQLARYDLTRAEGRSAALAAALAVLAPIKDSILAKDYACQLAGRLRIREEVALEQLRRMEVRQAPQAADGLPQGVPVAVSAQGAVYAAPRPQVQGVEETLPDYTDSRLSFEREMLSALACNPVQGAPFAALLETISWRAPVHERLAKFLAERLGAAAAGAGADGGAGAVSASVSCAALAGSADEISPLAGAILLGGRMADSASVGEVLTYLFEELTIGDMEESIARAKLRLAALQRAGKGETPEADELFRTISTRQKEALALRKAHQPLGL